MEGGGWGPNHLLCHQPAWQDRTIIKARGSRGDRLMDFIVGPCKAMGVGKTIFFGGEFWRKRKGLGGRKRLPKGGVGCDCWQIRRRLNSSAYLPPDFGTEAWREEPSRNTNATTMNWPGSYRLFPLRKRGSAEKVPSKPRVVGTRPSGRSRSLEGPDRK